MSVSTANESVSGPAKSPAVDDAVGEGTSDEALLERLALRADTEALSELYDRYQALMYLVMVGLPEAPAGQTYQAWYITNDQPTSAGLLIVDADGYAVLVDSQPIPGTEVVALTREPAGGSEQPTSAPFAVGELRPA